MFAQLLSDTTVVADAPDDTDLTSRIVASYRQAITTPAGSAEAAWLNGELFDRRPNVHERIMSDEPGAAGAMLRNPGGSYLLYGFEDNYPDGQPANIDAESLAKTQYDQLVTLAEAVAAQRLTCPHRPPEGSVADGINEILAALDARFGFKVAFPNPFSGERGIETGRGIVTYRATNALYQAWRIRQITQGIAAPRVLEIGAGLGRTAYYAWQFGIRDYTIVDLPLTCVAQANFLGRTLGEQHLRLHGESGSGSIRIMPPPEFLDMSDHYDVALNADSLTEMTPETAQTYYDHIERRATVFLSINHEENHVLARDLFAHRPHSRAPYWMRTGYVEEQVAVGQPDGGMLQRMRKRLRAMVSAPSRNVPCVRS